MGSVLTNIENEYTSYEKKTVKYKTTLGNRNEVIWIWMQIT